MESNWANFLNPEVIRRRFTTAGLYLIAHEILLRAIKDRLREFYSLEWTEEDGWIPSESYKAKVLALDPKGKNDSLRGSLKWLQNIEALDEFDIAQVRKLTDFRNKFAHELTNFVGSGIGPDFEVIFPDLLALVTKIERWWIINVEISTDPEYDGQEVQEDEITPGSVAILQMLSRVALGDEEEAWEFYKAFEEQSQGKK